MMKFWDMIFLILILLTVAWLTEPQADVVENYPSYDEIDHWLPYKGEPFKKYAWEERPCWD